LAPWVIEHFPAHRIYVEPFGGAASVLLRKERSYNEIYNDLDGELVNLFQILRSDQSEELLRLLALTPYARAEYKLALQPTSEPVERARRMLVRSHMAHGTGGARIDREAGFRIDGVSGTTNVASEWAKFPSDILPIIERFRGVSIQNKPALDLIKDYNSPNVLIYLDPPYLPSTRSKVKNDGHGYHTYSYELTHDDHCALLDAIASSTAMIVLSGYPNPLYDVALKGWRREESAARAHRNSPRTEVLWINPAASAALDLPSQQQLFA